MRIRILFFLLLASLIVVMPASAQRERQQDPEVVVVHTVADEEDDEIDLTVYFSVRDQTGRPVATNKIDGGLVSLGIGDEGKPVILEEPRTPIKIGLILDASGSMAEEIGSVRAAANQAVDRAPTGTEFAVWTFNDLNSDGTYEPSVNFTTDRGIVKEFINNEYVSPPGAPTCLFTAGFKAAEFLNQNLNPEDRRALILFTDGKDERADGTRCSDRTLEDLTREATEVGTFTPVYTIGMCDTTNCTNVDLTVLTRIADQTNALEAFGTVDQMTQAFFDIMDDIISQKVARVSVKPCEENQATLIVNVINVDDGLRGVIRLPAGHKCYSPFAEGRIDNFSGDNVESKLRYDFSFTMDNTSSIPAEKIKIIVSDPNNTLVYSNSMAIEVLGNDDITIPLSLPITTFTNSGKYVLQVQALTADDVFFQPPQGQRIAANTLAQHEFNHEALNPVDLELVSIPFADYDTNTLHVNEIRVNDPQNLLKGQERFLKYQIVLLDGDAEVYRSEEYDFSLEKPEIAVPLKDIPDQFIPKKETQRYGLKMRLLFPPGGEAESPVKAFDFAPLVEPGFFRKYGLWFLGILLLIAGGAFLWRFLRTRPFRRKDIPPPQPYTAPTGMLGSLPTIGGSAPVAAAQAPPKLRLRVVMTPDPSQKRDEVAKSYPYVIGRAAGKANLVIDGDNLLSGAHATINHHDGSFTVTDNSKNGLFINDQRQQPGVPIPIKGRTMIRLGQWTHIEISQE